MASSTVFELISASLGKSLESIIIPNFVEVAVNVVSNFGDEPPSQESMKVLFEDAFKKVLANPGKKTKAKSPTKKKTKKAMTDEVVSDKSDSSDDEKTSVKKPKTKAPRKPKTPTEKKETKPKKAPAPKQQWVNLDGMLELLKPEDKYYCGFVADRGVNAGKFCATELTEEHKNCGTMTENEWVPHSPEKEFEEVGKVGHKMRCKKCWAKGKNGSYRKTGRAEELIGLAQQEQEGKTQVEVDIPEIPETPNDDIKAPEEPVEEDKYEAPTDDENELEDVEDPLEEQLDDSSTEDILDGLLDDGPNIEDQ